MHDRGDSGKVKREIHTFDAFLCTSVALAVQSAKLTFNKSAPYDEELVSLITAMIKLRPEERPTISEVRRRAEEMRL